MHDVRIYNIGSIITWSIADNSILVDTNQEIYIKDGKIIDISESVQSASNEINAQEGLVTPGFIDSHTHPIFFGDRSKEMSWKLKGKSYQEIASMGGGILSSVNALRNCTEDELYEYCLSHTKNFLSYGTTTIEAKSGYGLTIDDEIKSLRVIKKLGDDLDLDIIPTFLGAHDIPEEYKGSTDSYVDSICNEMIPAIAEEKLAVFCDVFCEDGFFDVVQSRKILETAKKFDLSPRLHADEFVDSGAAELAAEIGACSADHLMATGQRGIELLAKSNVISTLLPGTTMFLGSDNYVDARKFIRAGCEVALATDFNPGTCTIQSMNQIMFLGALKCGLTVDECFKATTLNPAKSLLINKNVGVIDIGFDADMVIWNLDNINELIYWFSQRNLISHVIKAGKVVFIGQE